MNSISNSGLIAGCGGKTYITDIKRFSGTTVVDMFGNSENVIPDALMWCSVCVGQYIFFSNQKYNNSLCVFDTQAGQLKQLSGTACRNLVKYENDLYFIDESNKTLMVYNLNDGMVKQFSDSKIEVFAIYGDALYYSSATGIGMINMKTKAEYAVLSSIGENLGGWNGMLIYSDFKNNGVLSVYNLSDGSFFRIEAVWAESFVTYENYIFAINRKEGNSVCRIDIAKGEIMRIYGEVAHNLHILNSDLYFTDKNDNWCKLSVTGDDFCQLRIN
ncbi:MAG: DUF5050 domain-containing protein [Clostridia bacterium]|nr:DUF5050 domain-containing protein [Clostridia bacterium]